MGREMAMFAKVIETANIKLENGSANVRLSLIVFPGAT